uniref:Uncharacterized protein n=1 Tax=Nelumbo nucifera TaxID=4432 RepID=A0A822Z811_NELNU|nr:TPA_asm: hypothetical protein HUJ06_013842 [Nelumbo nucifera]
MNAYNRLFDLHVKKFYLAGNVQEQEQQHHHHQQQQQQRGSSSSGREKAEEESFGNNIFSGFDAELLAQAFGVEKETVRKLQGKNDERGRIIHVEEGLQVIRSISSEEEEEQQEQQRQNQMKANGLEESFCNMRFRQNIGKATSADVYTPFGGRVTNVNSQSLPILSFLDLSAERGYLYKV